MRPWSSFIDGPTTTPLNRLSVRHTHAMPTIPGLCAIEHAEGCRILIRLCSAPPFVPGLGIAKMTHSDYQAAAQTETKTRPMGNCILIFVSPHSSPTPSHQLYCMHVSTSIHHSVVVSTVQLGSPRCEPIGTMQ